MSDTLCSSPDQYEDEELDPRVKVELDRLNRATDEINKLESALEEANNCFRHDLSQSSSSLQLLGRRLGAAVEKGRPYFEAMQHARKLHLDCQRTAVQYHRANAVHQAARSTISLAEERFSNPNHENHRQFDPAWQEMLNHATIKVLEAEAGRTASEREHERRAASFTAAQQRVTQLGRQLKGAISKARPYFEQKEAFDAQLEQMSQRVDQLQRAVASAKMSYAHALKSLEQISEEIHEQRRYGSLKREPGVGAEDLPSEERPRQTGDKDWSSVPSLDAPVAVPAADAAHSNKLFNSWQELGSSCSAVERPASDVALKVCTNVSSPRAGSSSDATAESRGACCGRDEGSGDEAATGVRVDQGTVLEVHQKSNEPVAVATKEKETGKPVAIIKPQECVKERDSTLTEANNQIATSQDSFVEQKNKIDAALESTAQDFDWITKTSQIRAATLSIATVSDECLYKMNPSGCNKSLSYVGSNLKSMSDVPSIASQKTISNGNESSSTAVSKQDSPLTLLGADANGNSTNSEEYLDGNEDRCSVDSSPRREDCLGREDICYDEAVRIVQGNDANSNDCNMNSSVVRDVENNNPTDDCQDGKVVTLSSDTLPAVRKEQASCEASTVKTCRVVNGNRGVCHTILEEQVES